MYTVKYKRLQCEKENSKVNRRKYKSILELGLREELLIQNLKSTNQKEKNGLVC